MPVQADVKPKIKKAATPSHGPTPCARCGAAAAKHVIETYVVATPEGGDHPTTIRQDLCGACLVGHNVAVDRGQDRGWSFGEVMAYDESTLRPFLLAFLSGEEEWALVSPTPTADYLDFFDRRPPSPATPRSLLARGSLGSFSARGSLLGSFSVGSFSASSFSETSSADAGTTFQLYDDQKLVSVAQSAAAISFAGSDDALFAGAREPTAGRGGTPAAPLASPGAGEEEGPTPGPVTPAAVAGALEAPKRTPRTPVMWTKEEDAVLQRVVRSFTEKDEDFRWQQVSARVPNRTGKQCRERYLNHLSPALKSKVWSPEEDYAIFSLFFRIGSKWSVVARVLRGRTDNGIKNRFHHLRRRLDRDSAKARRQYPSLVEDAAATATATAGDAAELERKVRGLMKILALESQRPTVPVVKGYVFGPFAPVGQLTMCARCGLFVPSRQTGDTICMKTNWCEACTKTPPYVVGDQLRDCHERRKE